MGWVVTIRKNFHRSHPINIHLWRASVHYEYYQQYRCSAYESPPGEPNSIHDDGLTDYRLQLDRIANRTVALYTASSLQPPPPPRFNRWADRFGSVRGDPGKVRRSYEYEYEYRTVLEYRGTVQATKKKFCKKVTVYYAEYKA